MILVITVGGYEASILNHPAIMNLGSWLLHFTWQGAVVGLLLALLLRQFRHTSPEIRYITCWVALGLMVILPSVTTLSALNAGADELPVSEQITTPTQLPHSSSTQRETAPKKEAGSNPILLSALSTLTHLRAYFALMWMLGVFVFALRLHLGFRNTDRLKTNASLELSNHVMQACIALCKKLNISQTVKVKSSAHIDQPILIGWLKPIVLLPASILAGLPLDQLEAILAHELAHVKRYDYFFSVFQSVLETLFFFHPAVWWISHHIRIEREYCCDDLAVKTLGGKKTYLNTLAQLEAYRTTLMPPMLSLSINKGSLLDRVHRIVTRPSLTQQKTTIKSRTTTMGITFFVFLSILTMIGVSAPSSPELETTGLLTQISPVDLNQDATTVVPRSFIELNTDIFDDTPSIHPLKTRAKITSGFGMRLHPILKVKRLHKGIDLLAPTGTPVYATANGIIKTVTESSGNGKYIVIAHTGGFETVYTNLSFQAVKEGAPIKGGEQIGESGNTGLSTAPHLHYEVHLNGKPVDPADYLPKK